MDKDLERALQYIQLLDAKVNGLQEMTFHTGLFVEYIQIQLASKLDHEGKALLELDMQDFAKWASARFEEMKEEAARLRTKNKNAGINLDED